MAAHTRRRLFTAAGLLVVGAAGLLMLLGQGPATAPTERERTNIAPAAPVVQGAGHEQQGSGRPRSHAPSPGARAASEDRRVRYRAERQLEQAEAATRAFLSALLRRESGEGGPQARRRIALRATRDLAQFVLEGGEPRVPAAMEAPARARLVGLEPVGLGDGRAELAATIERDGARSGLLVVLVRREERWRVADVR
jgi:hypothetical protein